jgi:hypothetical protein
MRVYLHIGTDKTGSTSIQGHLYANRRWMEELRVLVPAAGLSVRNGHASMLSELEDAALESLSAELDQAAEDGFRAVILSWEGMTFYSEEKITRLRSALGKYPVTILVYLREQADILQSGFLQRVKANSNKFPMQIYEFPRSPEERRLSKTMRRPRTRNYYRMLSAWRAVIPEAEFLVREFHKQALSGGDVVQDFFEQLGLPPCEGFLSAGFEDNVSLDVEGALAVQGWQEEGREGKELDRLSDIAYSMVSRHGPTTRYFLGKNTVKAIRRDFRGSNKKLAKEFVPGRKYPFSHEKECWRSEPFDSIRARAEEFVARAMDINQTPTLLRVASGNRIAGEVDLAAGWCVPVEWGVWSKGPESVLRFRLRRRSMPTSSTRVRLVIEGRYFADNTATRVIVNEQDFGDCDLAAGTEIFLPVESLLPHETVEITFQHHHPVAPRRVKTTKDYRQLAFGLKKLNCAYVLEEDYPRDAAEVVAETAGCVTGRQNDQATG